MRVALFLVALAHTLHARLQLALCGSGGGVHIIHVSVCTFMYI